MGSFAEEAAHDYQFTREAQDDYAIASSPAPRRRRRKAGSSARSSRSRSPAARARSRSPRTSSPARATPRRSRDPQARLRQGRHDHRRQCVELDQRRRRRDGDHPPERRRRLGLKPVARIVAHAAHAHEPAKFTTAPVGAMTKALKLAGWDAAEVDLYEVNEAFACVAMIAMRDLGIPHDKINVHGGATALGPPDRRDRARASWPRCSAPSKPTAARRASPASASAAARRRRWRWSWSTSSEVLSRAPERRF